MSLGAVIILVRFEHAGWYLGWNGLLYDRALRGCWDDVQIASIDGWDSFCNCRKSSIAEVNMLAVYLIRSCTRKNGLVVTAAFGKESVTHRLLALGLLLAETGSCW